MPCLSSLCTDLLIIQFQISNHLFSQFEVQRVAVIKFEADMNKKFKSLCCKRKYFSKSGFYENKNKNYRKSFLLGIHASLCQLKLCKNHVSMHISCRAELNLPEGKKWISWCGGGLQSGLQVCSCCSILSSGLWLIESSIRVSHDAEGTSWKRWSPVQFNFTFHAAVSAPQVSVFFIRCE